MIHISICTTDQHKRNVLVFLSFFPVAFLNPNILPLTTKKRRLRAHVPCLGISLQRSFFALTLHGACPPYAIAFHSKVLPGQRTQMCAGASFCSARSFCHLCCEEVTCLPVFSRLRPLLSRPLSVSRLHFQRHPKHSSLLLI